MDQNALLSKGMDIKLYTAAKSGDVKLFEQVLEKGTVHVFEEVTPLQDTALHTAAFYGHLELVNILIKLASENAEAGNHFLKAKNKDGNTALHMAAKGKCPKILEVLVKKDENLAGEKNEAGETALFKAAENGHVGMVEFLLNCTPESEELDKRKDGKTPLHVAVYELHIDVTAKLLKERPTLIKKTDVSGMTALHTLALVPPYKRARHWWELNKSTENIVKMLLLEEISLTHRVNAHGRSALHLGAMEGNAPLVKAIEGYGTDCTQISDNDGKTALHIAVEYASNTCFHLGKSAVKDIISSLASKRLIDCSDKNGVTAFHIADEQVVEDKSLFLIIRKYFIDLGARPKLLETKTDPEPAALPASASSPMTLPTATKSNWRTDMLSVNAVLIATVAFAAAFTLPGDIDSDEKPPVPFLLNVSLFKLFIVFDSLAFCSSVGSAVLLIYALFGNQGEDSALLQICFSGLWTALACIALTFGAAIHLLVARKCMWLAVLVWVMVCYLPIGVMLKALRGKIGLFTEARVYIVYCIASCIWLIMSALLDVGFPLYCVGAFLWEFLIWRPWRMLRPWVKQLFTD